MIPIRDEIRTQKAPLINYLIITINVAIFLHELSLGEQIQEFVRTWGLVPSRATRGIEQEGFSFTAHAAPWVTSMFIHGGWLHILGNMWFLHIFGDNVEDRIGKLRYLILYLAGGLLAALAQVFFAPGSDTPMVGASGAISAVVAAYLVLYPRARVLTVVPIFILFYFVQLPAFIFIGVWFGIQLLYGYASFYQGATGGVAWWAHIGGFLGGLVLALVLKIGTTAGEKREFQSGRVRFRKGRPS